MKQIINRFSILTVALIFGIGAMTACTSSKSGGNSTETASTGAAQQAAENNQSNSTETTTATPAKQTDILSTFKKGDDYKTSVRPKLLKDGWQPARTAQGEETCQSSGMQVCKEFPELEDGPSSGQGFIEFRWKKDGKILIVTTVDAPPFFDSYEFETNSEKLSKSQSTEPDVTGKYEAMVDSKGLIDGEQILQLKKDKTATFRNPSEDGTSEGTGSWNWDSAKELITVTLTIEYTPSGMEEGEKPEISKAVFQLTKEGKNLKVVSQTFAPDVPEYKGSLFKKL